MKTLLYKICILVSCIIFSFTAYTQSNVTDSLKIDSLKKALLIEKEDTSKLNTLNSIIELYFNNLGDTDNTNNAMQYVDSALKLSNKLNFKKGMADALYNKASVNYYQSNYPEAVENLERSLKIRKELNDKRGCAYVYRILNAAYGMQGFYVQNVQYAYACLKLWEEIGDKKEVAISLNDLGNIYISHDNYSEGYIYAEKALKISREIGLKWQIAYSLAVLSEIDIYNGKLSDALAKHQEALKLLKEAGDNSFNWWATDHYRPIGKIYQKQGEIALASGDRLTATEMFSNAQVNYKEALKYDIKNDLKSGIATGYINLADIDILFNKKQEADNYLKKALPLAKSVGYKIASRDGYYSLSRLDSINGNYQQAYNNYKMYILYRDSIVNQEGVQKALQSKSQYEFDKKEAVAKAEQAKKDAEAKRIKNQQYFTIAALGIIVLAAVIIALFQYRNNKHKKKANELLTQQKEKVESTLSELKSTQSQLIQSEKMASLGELTAGIAHEIQNPLNFVNNFSEINTELIDELEQEMNKGNLDDAKAIAKDIKDNEVKISHHGKRADAIVKGMLQHSQTSTGQKEPTGINKLADEYLRLSYHGLRAKDNSFNATLQTDFDQTIEKINIIPQDIGRVMLNLYNNAFYAVAEKKKLLGENYEPTVSVSTKKINDKIEIKVGDNGSGIPQKVIDKIFQPFFTTKPTGQGTGLGLSLAYDIIKTYGGEIKVKTTEGEGSEFNIILSV